MMLHSLLKHHINETFSSYQAVFVLHYCSSLNAMDIKGLPLVLVFIFSINLSLSAKIPAEFILCKRSDPEFEKCIAKAVQNTIYAIKDGYKELGIPKLEPMYVPKIFIKGNGGSVDLEQEYTDCQIYGPVTSTYVKADVSFSKEDCHFYFDTWTDFMTMTANYKFKGKLLLFQINGHGHANLSSINMTASHRATCQFYEKGGKEYINITKWEEFYLADRILFDYDNLIDGNPEMSANVLQVMNDNNQEVFANLKEDYQSSYGAIYKQIAQNVFSKIPFREIFLD